MDKTDNPYDILEITPGATEAEIKKAYRQLARKFHPDKQKTDEDREAASATFARISDAYDLLQDPVRRYDWRMKNESSQPRSSSASTSTSTATKTTTQSTTSQTKPKPKAKSGTSAVRSRTPPPARPQRMSAVPMRTSRASFAAPQSSPVGRRANSAGPGGRRVGSASPRAGNLRRSSGGSSMASAAAAAATTTKRSSSPGPRRRNRAVANEIPRRSMAGASPIRANSPRPGRRNNGERSKSGTRKPKSSPNLNMGSDAASVASFQSVSSRRVPKKPASGRSLDANSEHSRRTPRPSSFKNGSDAASVQSVGSRKMRRPTSRESINSMASMRRPSSKQSLSSMSSMKSSRSEPALRKKLGDKRKNPMGGISLRGSTANNATFDAPSKPKSALSRASLKLNPVSVGRT
mmetsp:Transcript_44693/g.107812  ORF Transcript_44693/g.107812 Transcript_44693/m.107812 type:complete len:407 (-) Transcript_44693:85-1305(-)